MRNITGNKSIHAILVCHKRKNIYIKMTIITRRIVLGQCHSQQSPFLKGKKESEFKSISRNRRKSMKPSHRSTKLKNKERKKMPTENEVHMKSNIYIYNLV